MIDGLKKWLDGKAHSLAMVLHEWVGRREKMEIDGLEEWRDGKAHTLAVV